MISYKMIRQNDITNQIPTLAGAWYSAAVQAPAQADPQSDCRSR